MLTLKFPEYTSDYDRQLKSKIENKFKLLSGNFMVKSDTHAIYVWCKSDYEGYWTGSSFGLIRGEQALSVCSDTAKHLIEYRELLPKACRNYEILPVIFY